MKNSTISEKSRSSGQGNRSMTQQNHTDTSLVSNNLLLVMNIDIDDYNKDVIHVYVDSNPLFLAQKFGEKHKLDEESMMLIAEQINNNLDALAQQLQEDLYGKNARFSNGSSSPSKNMKQQKRSSTMTKSAANLNNIPKSPEAIRKGSAKAAQGSPRANGQYRRNDRPQTTNIYQNSRSSPKRKQDLNRSVHSTSQSRVQFGVNNEEYAFRPEINEISRNIVEEKSRRTNTQPGNKFVELHDDWKSRGEKAKHVADDEMKKNCPFTPKINGVSKAIIESKDNMTFLERAREYEELRENKMKSYQESHMVEESVDPATGQHLYHPIIKRGPQTKRTEPISVHLYNQRFTKERAQTLAAEREKKDRNEGKVKIPEKSHAMVDERRMKRLEEIFALFDSDEDGMISSHKISLANVPREVLEIYAPFLSEMEEFNIFLDLEHFISASEKLIRGLTVGQKAQLFGFSKAKTDHNEFSFKPQINKKSEVMAKNRPYGQSELYKFYMDERQKIQDKKTELAHKKEAELMNECSFQPTLSTKNYYAKKGIKQK